MINCGMVVPHDQTTRISPEPRQRLLVITAAFTRSARLITTGGAYRR